jgi:hypothetical protein
VLHRRPRSGAIAGCARLRKLTKSAYFGHETIRVEIAERGDCQLFVYGDGAVDVDADSWPKSGNRVIDGLGREAARHEGFGRTRRPTGQPG